MTDSHPFRFGAVTSQIRTRQVLLETARKLEDGGFATMLLTDHLGEDRLSAIPALVSAADATTTLRVGSLVLNNDLRHPAVLAGEIATVDVVTDGRFEFGIGAGWEKEDYDRTGISLDPAPERIRRLEESINVLKAYFGSDVVNFSGEFYTITDMPAVPKAVQQPRPPILVGGGGKRVLSVAGRCADIIGVHLPATKDGTGQDFNSATPKDVEKRISWIKEAAGDRMSSIELCQNVFEVSVTNDRQAAAKQVAERFGMSQQDALDSPYFLLGSQEQIADQLRHNRERFGISYLILPMRTVDAMMPVVQKLAGT